MLYQELTKINKYIIPLIVIPVRLLTCEKLLCARLCNEGDDEKARYEECFYVCRYRPDRISYCIAAVLANCMYELS